MIYAIKKQGESNERLISRFKKLVQRSRVLFETKANHYHAPRPKKKHIRQAAILRAAYRHKRALEQFSS